MKNFISTVLISLLFSFIIGCNNGSGDSTINCSSLNFTACAGNPVGKWKVQDICHEIYKSLYADSCPAASSNLIFNSSDVTVEYRNDGTKSVNGDFSVIENTFFPPDCLTKWNETCNEVQSDFEQYDYVISANCKENANGCSCSFTTKEKYNEIGTLWKKENNKIYSKNASEGWNEGKEYCVDGDYLIYKNITLDSDTNETEIVAYTIMKKQ